MPGYRTYENCLEISYESYPVCRITFQNNESVKTATWGWESHFLQLSYVCYQFPSISHLLNLLYMSFCISNDSLWFIISISLFIFNNTWDTYVYLSSCCLTNMMVLMYLFRSLSRNLTFSHKMNEQIVRSSLLFFESVFFEKERITIN